MRLQLPGRRPLDATLDGRDGAAVVVACPPHPQLGGDRTDSRLQAVSESLPKGVDCLRFDYGPWDDGDGEQTDVRRALAWAHEQYASDIDEFDIDGSDIDGSDIDGSDIDGSDSDGSGTGGSNIGLFGYSFGAMMALASMADDQGSAGTSSDHENGFDLEPAAISVLAPGTGNLDNRVLAGLECVSCPVQVVYGERDDTVEWGPVVERARELGHEVDAMPADHFFVGQQQEVATRIATFLGQHLLENQ